MNVRGHIRRHWVSEMEHDQMMCLGWPFEEKRMEIPRIVKDLKARILALRAEPIPQLEGERGIAMHPPKEFRHLNFIPLMELKAMQKQNSDGITELTRKLDGIT